MLEKSETGSAIRRYFIKQNLITPEVERHNASIEIHLLDEAAPIAKSRGRDRMFEELRRQKILKSSMGKMNHPYARYVKAGYFEIKVWLISSGSGLGSDRLSTTIYVTPKGIAFLNRRLGQATRRQVTQYQSWVQRWSLSPLEIITTP
ncbi:phage antirepressor KilAC domain-containing protein [Deinococcus sp.]|uniref:phage antirepressor KilAC domain-containing protein n=1 Tax=Deinococcus sp. TaxID=47478 RepID=UPI003C79CD1C